MERKLAATLFATPPTSSFEEALSYFERADKLDNKFARNLLYMGDTYVQVKRKDDARASFERLLQLPAVSAVDRQLHEQARAKLSKL